MKKLLTALSVLLLCNAFGFGTAHAADPNKIQVGILLPLTGTFEIGRAHV